MQSKYVQLVKPTILSNERYISSQELETRAGIELTREQIKVLKRAYKSKFFIIYFISRSLELTIT